MQANFDNASRELMEIRAEKNDLDVKGQEVNYTKDQVNNELEDAKNRITRAANSKQSKLNNVRAVMGDKFDESAEHVEILADVERSKHQHLLNAISLLVSDPVISSELPDLVQEIEGTLAEQQIRIPSRPASALDRPPTGQSQNSGSNR